MTHEAIARARDHFVCDYSAYPFETPLFQKCHEALQVASTPLVVLLADDDFMVPATLEAAAERLRSDSTISVAHGAAMSLSLDLGPGIDPLKTLRSRSRRHLVAEQPSGVDRITHWLRQYASIYYSVMRRPRLTANFKLMTELKQDYDFGQLLCGCLCLAEGKAVAVEGLYYVVMDTPIGASRNPSATLIPGWRRLLTQPDFSHRYATFKELVLGELAQHEASATAEDQLDAAFADYVFDRMSSTRVGELERLRRNGRAAVDSLARLGAIASRGLRAIAREPLEVTRPRVASRSHEPLGPCAGSHVARCDARRARGCDPRPGAQRVERLSRLSPTWAGPLNQGTASGHPACGALQAPATSWYPAVWTRDPAGISLVWALCRAGITGHGQ